MGNFLEVFSNLSGDQKGQLAMQAAKLVPTIIGFNQASKAADQQREYLEDIKELEKNRQVVTNPYANVTNPYANLQVATKAAEMQADQTDIALANTLDQLRQTGAGGATALAQAALKSKQGIAADIQRQEVQNQRLQAQGQQQMEMAQARGQAFVFQAQERRDEAQLDRLQGLADIEAARRAGAFSSGVGGLTSALGGAAQALINPQAQNFGGDFNAMDIANSLTDPSSIGQGLQGSFSGGLAPTGFDTSNMSILNPSNTGGGFNVSNLDISLSNP